ncbi:thymidylate kinase [Peptacetobacter hominis]|uniref:Thymidylate kinase n=1 Tax=Peptacetobacter hominis TaxID=2743610 RepID=A0A544QTL2_9FIRM|nr:deoxynucleoside kinase [Peptacetobacter hominis]TQQ84031.1 thymidylate kinase [Peptacetobacter hominis]
MSGKLIIIESGSDASGKATQSELIYEKLKNEGVKVRKVQYPNYESESSTLVKMYLRGDFGKNADDVDAYIASTFFTADRYASYKTEWEDFYKEGGVVIADRYTTSNMVHQASKMAVEDRDKYLDWLDDYEYGMFKMPRPDVVIFLNVPVEFSRKLMADRMNKFTGEKEKDIHERDAEYLERTYRNSLYIADKYGWKIVECIKDGELRSIDDINNEIYKIVHEVL